jgi:hypothetical protein
MMRLDWIQHELDMIQSGGSGGGSGSGSGGGGDGGGDGGLTASAIMRDLFALGRQQQQQQQQRQQRQQRQQMQAASSAVATAYVQKIVSTIYVGRLS